MLSRDFVGVACEGEEGSGGGRVRCGKWEVVWCFREQDCPWKGQDGGMVGMGWWEEAEGEDVEEVTTEYRTGKRRMYCSSYVMVAMRICASFLFVEVCRS